MNESDYKQLVADIKAMVAEWHYNKNETYTQREILDLIADAVSNLKLVDVVTELPTVNIKNNQLYLVVNKKNIEQNKFDIFLYANNDWERIDGLEFDIANYYTKNEADNLLATKSDISHRHDNSTSNIDGFMSKSDKTKLDGVDVGANKTVVDESLSTTSTNPVQNKVINAGLDKKVDKITGKGLSTEDFTTSEKTKLSGIEAGANKTIVDSSLSTTSTNPVQNKVIKTSLDTKAGLDTATTSSNGLMSKEDKSKLDGIATEANKTVVDSSLSTTSTNPVQNRVIKTELDLKATKDTATTSNDGLMSSSDKTKLNGVATGANKTVVDSSLSTTSTNPVQNKIINSALGNKANSADLATVATSGSYNDLTGKPTIPSANATASNIKMDGTQSAGSLATFAKADHVHPTDTTRAAASHTHTKSQITDFPTTMAPASHSHGNITNDGVISNQASKNVVTDANGKITTENKLTVDSSLSSTSTNPVQNKVINSALAGKSNADHTHTVDSSLSDSSTNPVQNKVVNSALSNLRSDLETAIDTVSTSGTVELQSYAKKSDLATVATSGSYNDLTGKPTIPSKTSQLTNDGDGTNVFVKNNDSRLTNARTPTSHTHGNISNDGKIGSTANIPIITGSNGVLQAGSFGTTANTFCQGNDSRLSNARTPVFNHIGATSTATKDLNGYTTGGFYYVNSDANEAPYVSNQPWTSDQKSFFLLVETWGASNASYVKQTLTYYTTGKTYVRTRKGSGGWNSWIEITKDTVYTHPSYTARTGKPTANQTPGFGGTITISQITSDATGHVTGATDRTITIPATEASTSSAGLMSSTDKTKLDGITAGANKYTHPNSGVTAGTNQSSNQTPSFNSTFNIPKLTFDAQGHITASANSTVKIPALPTASTSQAGIVQLNDNINSTSTAQAGTANAVKKAYDLANTKSTVSFSQTKTSGVEIGIITIDGTATKLYQQDNNTTYAAGTNLSLSGTTFNHATSGVGAKSSGLYKTVIDAQGHITSATAVAKADITGLGIPAQDTVYTHPKYTARTGVPTANATLSFGGTFKVSQPVSDATGHITALNERTYTLPSFESKLEAILDDCINEANG